MRDPDVKTILAYLEGAQTIVALYETLEGPELHTFAFKALADALSSPALLAAQLHLAPDHATVMLIADPIGATVVVPLRDTDGSP